MNLATTYRVLGAIDAKSVGRDALLRWMALLAVAIALALRYGVPPLSVHLMERYAFDFTVYYPLLISGCIMLMPILTGMVAGFLLLDQRDDNTLSALQVTPMPMRHYVAYRITLPMILSCVLSCMLVVVADLTPASPLALVIMAVSVAPLAPMFALFLASFANNKVQGFAYAKANGIVTMPPLVAWFVPGNWQFLFGLVPTYWPSKALWVYAEGGHHYWVYALIGCVFQAWLVILLLRRFSRRMFL